MNIKTKFELQQEVYLITDVDQLKRFVTGIVVRPNNALRYLLSCGDTESEHYDFEITEDKNYKA